jgi:hypothetical protein
MLRERRGTTRGLPYLSGSLAEALAEFRFMELVIQSDIKTGPAAFDGAITLIVSTEDGNQSFHSNYWQQFSQAPLDVRAVEGSHVGIMLGRFAVRETAQQINAAISRQAAHQTR